MPDNAMISAIVSTYASEEFMAECLDDLIGQTAAERLEIVVVDADSPQGEGGIVARYKERFPRITYIRTPERIGVYAAWNVAIRASRGEYLLTFSTNDRLAPDACEVLARYLDEHPGVDLVYGDTHLTDLPHQRFDSFPPSTGTDGPAWEWPDFSYFELLVRCMVGPHPMWRKRVHEQVGYFDETFRSVGDQDFWLRLGRTCTLRHIPHYTGLYWRDDQALSVNETAHRELERIRKAYMAEYMHGRAFGPCDKPRQAILRLLAEDRLHEAVHVFRIELAPCLLGELASLAEQVSMLARRGKAAQARALLQDRSRWMPDFPELDKMLELLAQASTQA